MSNGNFSFKSQSNESDKKNENDRPKVLVALIFLLLSFACIFCSSQGALWVISEDRVEAELVDALRAWIAIAVTGARGPWA